MRSCLSDTNHAVSVGSGPDEPWQVRGRRCRTLAATGTLTLCVCVYVCALIAMLP